MKINLVKQSEGLGWGVSLSSTVFTHHLEACNNVAGHASSKREPHSYGAITENYFL